MFRTDVLASNIKKCRINIGLTQQELAERLFVSSQAISKWECGQSMPDLINLSGLSDIFSTSVDQLLGNTQFDGAEKAFIGIDGGATKTEFILFTESGHILNRLILDGSNPNAVGKEKSFAIIKLGIDTMLASRADVSGVFAGVAGFSSGDNMSAMREMFEKTYPMMNVSIGSDILNVISSATDLDRCVAMICGTGFSVFASIDGELHRVGGWGYLLGEKGSGFDIGRDALRAVLAECDGFGEKTLIRSLAEEKLGGDVWSNISKIYAGGDSFVASFAPIVFDAFEKGDAVARRILEENADMIAFQLDFAMKTYNSGKIVVMAGGLLSGSDVLTNMLREKLGADVQLIVPPLPQIYGACVRCCRKYGVIGEGFFENFKADYEAC